MTKLLKLSCSSLSFVLNTSLNKHIRNSMYLLFTGCFEIYRLGSTYIIEMFVIQISWRKTMFMSSICFHCSDVLSKTLCNYLRDGMVQSSGKNNSMGIWRLGFEPACKGKPWLLKPVYFPNAIKGLWALIHESLGE